MASRYRVYVRVWQHSMLLLFIEDVENEAAIRGDNKKAFDFDTSCAGAAER